MTALIRTDDYALELRGLTKIFKSDLLKGKQTAVENLTCTFRKGACTGLLGHNGAGKTTTIRMILGLVKQDVGEILFEGKPLKTESRRAIGYMPEVSKLAGALTVEEALTHQLRLYASSQPANEHKAAVDQMLAKVGLGNHRRKRTKHLSKGMARRLAWAQAIVHRPRLLILDEPGSGLDPLGRHEMLDWIREERKHGTSIILCTHDLSHLDSLCDEYHILRGGKLVLSSTDEKVVRAPYNLALSGGDESVLHAMATKHSLPVWKYMGREGFLHVLGFAEYAPAAQWMTAAVKEGLVIVRFGDSAYAGEGQLLSYFERT